MCGSVLPQTFSLCGRPPDGLCLLRETIWFGGGGQRVRRTYRAEACLAEGVEGRAGRQDAGGAGREDGGPEVCPARVRPWTPTPHIR